MMKRNVSIVSVCACLLVAAVMVDAQGKSGKAWSGKPARQAGFTATGEFSGVLSGAVLVGTETVEVTPKTTIYRVGGGAVEFGSAISGVSVQASGDRLGDKLIARLIVVSAPTSGRDFSQETLPNTELPKNAAR